MAKITTDETKADAFKPVTVTITLENAEELAAFWAMANASIAQLRESVPDHHPQLQALISVNNWNNFSDKLWSSINSICLNRNLVS